MVIPTCDRWQILKRTLQALGRQTVSGFEIIVVVDGEDQVVPELPNVQVTVCTKRGPGAARNTGLHETTRPLVLFLGDDILPTAGMVESHLTTHARHREPNAAVLGHVEWHPESKGRRLHRWMDWSRTQFEYANLADLDGQDVGFSRFYSSNVSLRTDFLLDVGGFDEDFIYYYEDLDLGWRLGQRGLRLIYARAAGGQHLHNHNWKSIERRFEGIARGERLMAAKHDWFVPFFRDRVETALGQPPTSRLWASLVELLPASTPKLRSVAEDRANRYYYRRLAPAFLRAWEAGARSQSEVVRTTARTAP